MRDWLDNNTKLVMLLLNWSEVGVDDTKVGSALADLVWISGDSGVYFAVDGDAESFDADER